MNLKAVLVSLHVIALGDEFGLTRQNVRPARRGLPKKRIDANLAEGLRRHVNSTPTFIIGGKTYATAISYDELKAIVDSAAKK